MKRFIIFMISIVAMLSLSSCACTVIDNSEVGIEFKKFGLTDQGELDAVSVTGYNIYNPITKSVFKYPVFVQTADYKAFEVRSKDGTKFMMDPLLMYRIESDRALDIFTKYRLSIKDLENTRFPTFIQNAYRDVAGTYSADSLMSNKPQFEEDVKAYLNTTMGKDGFFIEEFTMDVVPPEEMQQSIEAKNKSIQDALKAENDVKAAEAKAKIAVATAKGEAEAMKVKADAEAYYNRTISASLSNLIVQEDWIEKWNGELPTYSGAGTPLINLPK